MSMTDISQRLLQCSFEPISLRDDTIKKLSNLVLQIENTHRVGETENKLSTLPQIQCDYLSDKTMCMRRTRDLIPGY